MVAMLDPDINDYDMGENPVTGLGPSAGKQVLLLHKDIVFVWVSMV